jgi:hypothetical protein
MEHNKTTNQLLHKDIIMGNCVFEECSWESVKHLFLSYHYLKTMPAGIMAVYGLFDKNMLGIAVGGAVFCNGRIQYEGKYLEFSRMWMSDKYGTNTESWFMAKCIKALKKKYSTYEGIVTWADASKGHTGTIYLAANFVYDGDSRKVKKFTGKNKKVIYQRTATVNDICVGEDMPKKRFIYYFNSKKREQLKRNRL